MTSERDRIFDSDPTPDEQKVAGADPARPAQAPIPVGTPGPDHRILAGMLVKVTGFVCARVGVPLSDDEKVEGQEKWARALAANLPDTKLGPTMLVASALVWSVGTIAEHWLAVRAARQAQVESVETVQAQDAPAADKADKSGPK